MAEDYGLCTYEKHHKQKILFFLSSMRSYADEIKKNKCELIYYKFDEKYFEIDYIDKIKKIIISKKINEITSFEVENKLFEKKLAIFLKKQNIKWNVIKSPMFMNSRSEFKEYVDNSKKILMGNFL